MARNFLKFFRMAGNLKKKIANSWDHARSLTQGVVLSFASVASTLSWTREFPQMMCTTLSLSLSLFFHWASLSGVIGLAASAIVGSTHTNIYGLCRTFCPSLSLLLCEGLARARCIVGVLAFNLTAQFHWPAWESSTRAGGSCDPCLKRTKPTLPVLQFFIRAFSNWMNLETDSPGPSLG